MTLLKRLSIGAAVLLVIGAVSVVLAQTTGSGQQASPMYDVKTETTITGTIESVQAITEMGARGHAPGGMGHHGLGGMHLVVKTEKEAIGVHLGPTAYLTEKGITLAKGDAVEIIGSRVTMGNEPVIIAKQIKKGDKTWTLRDASGRPLWSGRGR